MGFESSKKQNRGTVNKHQDNYNNYNPYNIYLFEGKLTFG